MQNHQNIKINLNIIIMKHQMNILLLKWCYIEFIYHSLFYIFKALRNPFPLINPPSFFYWDLLLTKNPPILF